MATLGGVVSLVDRVGTGVFVGGIVGIGVEVGFGAVVGVEVGIVSDGVGCEFEDESGDQIAKSLASHTPWFHQSGKYARLLNITCCVPAGIEDQ